MNYNIIKIFDYIIECLLLVVVPLNQEEEPIAEV